MMTLEALRAGNSRGDSGRGIHGLAGAAVERINRVTGHDPRAAIPLRAVSPSPKAPLPPSKAVNMGERTAPRERQVWLKRRAARTGKSRSRQSGRETGFIPVAVTRFLTVTTDSQTGKFNNNSSLGERDERDNFDFGGPAMNTHHAIATIPSQRPALPGTIEELHAAWIATIPFQHCNPDLKRSNAEKPVQIPTRKRDIRRAEKMKVIYASRAAKLENAQRMLAEGIARKDIAKALGMSPSGVSIMLVRAGVATIPPGKAEVSRRAAEARKALWPEVSARKDMSAIAIGKELGVSANLINRIRREMAA